MEGVNIEGENMEGVISLGVIAGEYTTVGAGAGARRRRALLMARMPLELPKPHANKVVDRGRFLDTVLISIRLTCCASSVL